MFIKKNDMLMTIPKTLLISAGLALILYVCLEGKGLRQASAQEQEPQAAIAKSPPSAGAAVSPSSYQRLIDRNCVTCHNEELNTGNFRLDNVDVAHVPEGAAVWEKVVHKLRTGEMPPPDRPQLSKGARKSLLSWLVTSLDEAAAVAPNPGRPAIHRLNRSEYANAIRDLLSLEIDGHALLPADGSEFGFDNNADSLGISPMLLERYMSAASKISRLAIGEPAIRPSVQIYETSKLLKQDDRMSEDFPFGSRGGISVRHHFPLDAEYVIKVNTLPTRLSADELEVRVDGARVALFEPKNDSGMYKDKDKEWKSEAKEDWGMEVRFAAKAGTRPITISFLKRTLAREGVAPRRMPPGSISAKRSSSGPSVIDFEIGGPYDAKGVGEENPSRLRIFVRRPTGPGDEEACATEILSTIARRAYRRPVTDEDVQILLSFYENGRSEGGFEVGIQWALERILVDPEFLFRIEIDPVEHAPAAAYYLSDLELASRLSFFLWSSIPDDELLEVAERGELKDPAVLERQARRMLDDARSETLVTNFASQWLHLRNVRAVTPDLNLFPEFDDNLREAMQRETELFVASQLHEDRSVVDLLRSDYTFLNERLARHYGIPNIYGSRFRRVDLDDPNRGGLLSQASILTVTSYATRTSPVRRGKWLLENILGSPPPPPPANVPDLPETGEGGEAATVRERMELHRKDPLCASCHVKMDALGFALENFDAVGKWRTTTEDNLPLDSMGTLPDGTILAGPAGLRDVLLGKSDEFVITVTQKLLTYSLGRGLEYYDQPAIRKIVREAAPDDYRWSSIILGITKSTPFQMRRTSP